MWSSFLGILSRHCEKHDDTGVVVRSACQTFASLDRWLSDAAWNWIPNRPSPVNCAVDLSNCAREPIHIPGMIQPHGLLLALDESGLIIRQASENSGELVNIPPGDLVDGLSIELLGTRSECPPEDDAPR